MRQFKKTGLKFLVGKKALLALLAGFVMSLPVAAVARAGSVVGAPLVISNVKYTSLSKNRLIEVQGARFDNGHAPSVTINGQTLLVSAYSSTSISAELPANLADGEYDMSVSTGVHSKQNDTYPFEVTEPVAMRVACIDWFVLGKAAEDLHSHVEVYVKDAFGNAVNGAQLTRENSRDGLIYSTSTTVTENIPGPNQGAGCSEPVDGGVDVWNCCINAGTWAGLSPADIPKGYCPPGFYSTLVTAIEPPPGTNLVWDGVSPQNGVLRTLTGP